MYIYGTANVAISCVFTSAQENATLHLGSSMQKVQNISNITTERSI